MGKTSDGSQVLHVQAEKADELDLSNLYPDAHVVSVLQFKHFVVLCRLKIKGPPEPSLECGFTVYGNIHALDFNDTFEFERNVDAAHKSLLLKQQFVMDIVTGDRTLWIN